MSDPHTRPETTETLIDDLEDLRELLSDQIPTLNDRAEPLQNDAQGDTEIPLITDAVALEPATTAPQSNATGEPDTADTQKSATYNPFLPTEKLKQLALERATIEKLFHDQLAGRP